MRLHEIINIIKRHFLLGIMGVIFLCALAAFCYFIIYKKILKGKKDLNFRQALPVMLIAGYIIMVLGVTFLSRPMGIDIGGVNLRLFSSYKEAWNTFTLRSWQFIIFNIVMFVPLGMLLPIFYERFRRSYITIGMGVIFTVLIECVQLITHRGIFELDDLFNNTLGTIIGYCVVMAVLTLIKGEQRSFRKVVLYLLPIFMIVGAFVGIFIKYNLNEFGNLSGAYIYKTDLKNVDISLNTNLSNEQRKAVVYKAPTLNKKEATIFAKEFFSNMGLDISNLEIDAYSDEANYWIRGDISYLLRINYLNSTYSYTDFSIYDDGMEENDCGEAKLYETIEKYGVAIPKIAQMESIEEGQYQWKVEKHKEGSILTDGTISCEYYNDDTIKGIRNSMVTYEKVKEANIISEQEAYEQLKDGKFRTWVEEGSINSMSITEVKLDYMLDTKGFYQPVYLFEVLVNGNESQIMIPALY